MSEHSFWSAAKWTFERELDWAGSISHQCEELELALKMGARLSRAMGNRMAAADRYTVATFQLLSRNAVALATLTGCQGELVLYVEGGETVTISTCTASMDGVAAAVTQAAGERRAEDGAYVAGLIRAKQQLLADHWFTDATGRIVSQLT